MENQNPTQPTTQENRPLETPPVPESHSAPAFQGEALEGYGRKFHFPKYIFLGIVFVILLVIVTGAYLLGKNSSNNSVPIPSPAPVVYQSPTPTPDLYTEETERATADWKTYTNTKYNYSLRYPQSFDIVKGPGDYLPDEAFQTTNGISFSGDQNEKDSNYGTALSISVNPQDKNGKKLICISSEDCLEKYRLNAFSPPPDNTIMISKTIDNQTYMGFKYGTKNLLYTQDSTYLALYKDGEFYLINYTLNNESNGQLEKTVNQIFSTFKFTDSKGTFCGGFAGKACPSGYTCKLDGNYPDAGGTCVK